MHSPRELLAYGGRNQTCKGSGQTLVSLQANSRRGSSPEFRKSKNKPNRECVMTPRYFTCFVACWYRHVVMGAAMVFTAIGAISVHGGGDIKVEGSFPKQPSLALSVNGGGDAYMRGLPADSVSVAVHGGGGSGGDRHGRVLGGGASGYSSRRRGPVRRRT